MSYSWGAADGHFLMNIIYISFVRKTSPWFKSYFNGHQAASKRHIGTRAKQQFSLFSLCFSTQWKASSHMLYWLSVTSFCDVGYHCPLAINLNVFRAPFEMGSSSTPFSSFSPILRQFFFTTSALPLKRPKTTSALLFSLFYFPLCVFKTGSDDDPQSHLCSSSSLHLVMASLPPLLVRQPPELVRLVILVLMITFSLTTNLRIDENENRHVPTFCTCAARMSLSSSTSDCPCFHGRSKPTTAVQSSPGRSHPFAPTWGRSIKSYQYISYTSPSLVRCQGRALSQSLCISGVCLLRRRVDATKQPSVPFWICGVYKPFVQFQV